MPKKKYSKHIQTVLSILQDEVNGDVSAALKKMTDDYSMTWVYMGKNRSYFPTTSGNIKKDIEEVYPITGRTYEIMNIAESDTVVMVEMIESYPDPETKKVYRTPLVIVLEMKRGKIRTGRHYCDPRLSYEYLTKAAVKKAYKKSTGPRLVIS